MEKYLYGVIALLLVSITGLGVYSVVRNPQETAQLPQAAASALGEAVEEVQSSMTTPESPTAARENTTTTRSDDDGDEDEDEDRNDDSKSQTATTQSGTTQTTQTSTQAAGTYTMAQVATHKSATSCYTVVNGSVYDLTTWIKQHPGGSQAILSLCGKDGTASFEGQHGGEKRPESELASHKIGTLAK